ncbi:adenosine deaminase family protein [Sphingomonas abaci]|uniref:Adenosine deaminase n=1 Tax=Sphingomonas abaci TaxID=237611 RepID=A0A7W7AGY6_9SPHN|nr:adenosine deaminase [Sphingomonas abaci]MBB4616080.1 adenosine deaminase [Sphingomonas abaci]
MPQPAQLGNVPESPIGRHVSLEQRAFFHAIPKVELHCHLLGAVRHDTFAELAARHHAPVTLDEIAGFYTRGEKPVGVLHVLRTLERHLLLEPDAFERIAYEYLADAAAENVRHAEFFWNPTASLRDRGLPYGEMQAAILAGMTRAEADHGITSLLIPSIDREAGADAALDMVQAMIAHPDRRVAGIGIDYRETENPPQRFVAAYALAREVGLRATAHAGEFGEPWTNVETAVDRLHVDRIDHGYTIVDNLMLAQRYAKAGMVFTVVPTNSWYLRTLPRERWALDHPIRRMAELGLRLHPNTDDPTLHNVTPAGAWELMYSHLGFDVAALRAMMLNGIAGSWATPEQRQRWQAEFTLDFDAAAAATDLA